VWNVRISSDIDTHSKDQKFCEYPTDKHSTILGEIHEESLFESAKTFIHRFDPIAASNPFRYLETSSKP